MPKKDLSIKLVNDMRVSSKFDNFTAIFHGAQHFDIARLEFKQGTWLIPTYKSLKQNFDFSEITSCYHLESDELIIALRNQILVLNANNLTHCFATEILKPSVCVDFYKKFGNDFDGTLRNFEPSNYSNLHFEWLISI